MSIQADPERKLPVQPCFEWTPCLHLGMSSFSAGRLGSAVAEGASLAQGQGQLRVEGGQAGPGAAARVFGGTEKPQGGKKTKTWRGPYKTPPTKRGHTI